MFHREEIKKREDVFVVAVDVDLTLVDSLTPWVEDLGFDISFLPTAEPDEALDLVPWFRSKGVVDPLSWWHKPDLYDNLQPDDKMLMFLSELTPAIRRATGKQVEIVVVSSCFPEHEASKRKFIRKYLPSSSGFISTSSKHFVDYDLIIDDSMGICMNSIERGKKVILVNSKINNPSIETMDHPLVHFLDLSDNYYRLYCKRIVEKFFPNKQE